MRFTLMASGSKGNSFLLQDQDVNLLIDCGTTRKYLSGCFKELGLTTEDLQAVLITHDHTDHISQVKMFRKNRIFSPVPLGLPVETVIADQPFAVEHLAIYPLALSHDAEKTTGYIIRNGQEKLVYITDTGYIRSTYLPLLKGADHIILESNHDVEMLMHTSRPMYIKERIASDAGHLCNEDCAAILEEIVTEKTRTVILAHISQEANTREKALQVSGEQLFLHHAGKLHPDFCLYAAGQYEMIKGGEWHEKTDDSCHCCAGGVEQLADICTAEI